jgi:SAM-dependent methyltransferase
VPRFLPLARDLVAAVAPPTGARVLDVGTGTGLAASLAREALGPDGVVVGIDPSVAMLERAIGRGLTVVAGMFPGLPFRTETFDAVLANLVLSHLPDYEAGLADALRVLRGGGRFGCSVWGPDAPGEEESDWAMADEIFESLAIAHGIDVTPPTPPCRRRTSFAPGENLEAALRGAGLSDVDVQARTYHWSSSIDDYFLGRAWRPRARYMRQQGGQPAVGGDPGPCPGGAARPVRRDDPFDRPVVGGTRHQAGYSMMPLGRGMPAASSAP